jgi:hypothetical protein
MAGDKQACGKAFPLYTYAAPLFVTIRTHPTTYLSGETTR